MSIYVVRYYKDEGTEVRDSTMNGSTLEICALYSIDSGRTKQQHREEKTSSASQPPRRAADRCLLLC